MIVFMIQRFVAGVACLAAAEPVLNTPSDWFARFATTWNEEAWLPSGSGRFSRYMRSDDDQGWQDHMRALQALATSGQKAVEPSLKALQGGTLPERILAAQALGYLGSQAAGNPLLKAARDDPEAVVRLYAVDSLGMLGGAELHADLAERANSEPDGNVKRHIGYALQRKQAGIDPQAVKGLVDWNASRMNTASVGETAPDFVLTSVGGETVRLSQFRGKKAVVLVFIYGDT